MKYYISFVLIFLLGVFGREAKSQDASPHMKEIIPDICKFMVTEPKYQSGYRCYELPLGFLISNNPKLSLSIAAELAEAGSRFEKYFGRQPARIAVVVGPSVYAQSYIPLRARQIGWTNR